MQNIDITHFFRAVGTKCVFSPFHIAYLRHAVEAGDDFSTNILSLTGRNVKGMYYLFLYNALSRD
jgi:hypothetical protein